MTDTPYRNVRGVLRATATARVAELQARALADDSAAVGTLARLRRCERKAVVKVDVGHNRDGRGAHDLGQRVRRGLIGGNLILGPRHSEAAGRAFDRVGGAVEAVGRELLAHGL